MMFLRAVAVSAAAFVITGCGGEADAPPASAPVFGDSFLRAAFAPYLGVWESEDGLIRQVFLEEPGGAAIRACLRRPGEDDAWRTVSNGTYVRDSEDDAAETRVTGIFTGLPGMGFDRLEVTGYAVPSGGMDFTNLAVTGESEELTYETWSAPSGGRFDYVVERVTEGVREPWFGGSWIFNGTVEASCR